MKITRTIKAALVLIVFTIGFTACHTQKLQTGGAYAPGSTSYTTNADSTITTNVVETAAPDLALFNIDSAFDLAYNTVDLIFKQEKNNRALLQSISPRIKEELDKIRPQAWEAVQRYTKFRRIYLMNPIPANLSPLEQALFQMQGFASAAQGALPQKSK